MEAALQIIGTGGAVVVKDFSLVESFIRSQDVKESSRHLYERTLKLFLKWAKDTGLLMAEITRAEVLRYKDGLLADGKSPLTVGGYLTVVRKFYEWAEGLKLYPNIAKGIKTPRRKQQFQKQPLTEDKGRELLAFFQGKALRDFALVNLLIRCGLRTIEASRALVGDIDIRGGRRVLWVHGKGRDSKDAFVVLTDKAYEPIRAYLQARGAVKADEPLFLSGCNRNKAGRLSTRAISRICKDGLKAIGLNEKTYTAHSLRHTTAVNILRAGGNLGDAQGVLRHANPATTQIYTATINEELRLRNPAEALIDGIL
jgi:integrase/recombinase XerC/integrase/recombinase XerD